MHASAASVAAPDLGRESKLHDGALRRPVHYRIGPMKVYIAPEGNFMSIEPSGGRSGMSTTFHSSPTRPDRLNVRNDFGRFALTIGANEREQIFEDMLSGDLQKATAALRKLLTLLSETVAKQASDARSALAAVNDAQRMALESFNTVEGIEGAEKLAKSLSGICQELTRNLLRRPTKTESFWG